MKYVFWESSGAGALWRRQPTPVSKDIVISVEMRTAV